MIWLALALAQDALTLPLGRAAVLTPPEVPRSIATTNSSLLKVHAVPPWLVVTAIRTGDAQLSVDHDAGRHTWSVTIPAVGDVVGSHVQTVGMTELKLSIDDGVLLPVPPGASAQTLVRPSIAQATPFGTDWVWIQGLSDGPTDLVIERENKAPEIVRIHVGASGPRPPGAHPIEGQLDVPLGGTLQVALGTTPVGQIVGHPSRLGVATGDDATALVLSGKKAGTTWLITGHADGHAEVYRIVVR